MNIFLNTCNKCMSKFVDKFKDKRTYDGARQVSEKIPYISY